jgi:glutamate-1-semialdehyde 2,1-aminomutase
VRTSGSKAIDERLRLVLGGGDTRTATWYPPYPLAIERGSGARIWDVDGNEFIDVLNNYSALVHGHGHPAIVEALRSQLDRGFVFPAPSLPQTELAERICARFDSVERVRFTNSGTEAVMLAVRAARAFTGRDLIVKTYGGYHGAWEQVALASAPDEGESNAAGLDGLRSGRWADIGIPAAVRTLVRLVPYNDAVALEHVFEEEGEQIAAVIFEPVVGEVGVMATPEFLSAARERTNRHGTLLVFDEVISARLHVGGMQAALGCTPDLTTLGKMIGGGLPVGAFGGRADVMAIFDERHEAHVPHHGTFNGNPLTMAAGCVSLDLLTAGEIERINQLGIGLAQSLDRFFEASKAPLRAQAIGSLVFLEGEAAVLAEFHRHALDKGVYLAPRGFLNLSTPMDVTDVDEVAERVQEATKALLAANPVERPRRREGSAQPSGDEPAAVDAPGLPTGGL